ncbi:hypothetical protein [uncultured Croceitalea sp.]|uniref:hypothetical protein n=1 Tax=uncultured Croceitalea sp. TaxID=1798908 RepID=UPI003305B74F
MTAIVINKKFLLFASVCCLLSVITTIGIHSSLFDLGALNFDERLLLFNDNRYLANRFWVILHCLFVLISMWGFGLVQFNKSPGFIGLGFVLFSVFAFTEIFRQIFVMFYLNGLRRNFLEADNTSQEVLRISIENAGLVGYSLFGLFILTFALGNIFYGLGLFKKNRIDTILAILLLFWGFGNLIAFGNEFWEYGPISKTLESFNIVFQPFFRLIIGFWMIFKWRKIKSNNDEMAHAI